MKATTVTGYFSPRRMKLARRAALSLAICAALSLSGCGMNRFDKRPPAWGDTLRPTGIGPATSIDQATTGETFEDDVPEGPAADFYRPGNDLIVQGVEGIAGAREQEDGDVKLNFQNANLLEVIKIILGDTLGLNYTVDPSVQGVVSMVTTNALQRDDLVPTLETLLRMNGAALVRTDGFYNIVPLANALAEVRAPQLGDSKLPLPRGFAVRVVPLRYVAAEEMAQILTPFMVGSNQLLRVDSTRNLLILASAGSDMGRLLETIDVFDVDQMKGMSVALFTPDFVDAKTLSEDLENLLTDPEFGLMRGLVRFVVVERINGLMAVTARAEHLARVREWVQRLDRNTGDANPRLFIYRVQNGKAADLATVLSGLFSGSNSQRPASLAPGLVPATVGQAPGNSEDGASPNPAFSPPGSLSAGLTLSGDQQVQIIADEPNNALLILARGEEYRQILAALKQLDVSPMQVLIEVTIAEVTLSDNLSFGVEWFFKNRVGSRGGLGTLDLGGQGIGAVVPGFSYAISGADGPINFVLNTLATESRLSIISSPSLLVLNNHEASIQVGDEVPITTQQQQSTVTDDARIINSIEYRETGVLLTVKPRINSGGLVIMEVEQEASQVPSTGVADPLTPRIQQRKISSTVAVNSGDTIILGGLIQEGRDTSESGLPALHKVPFLGALFGNKADNQDRTELIVLITPRAVSDGTTALQVTEEYRQRLRKLIPTTTERAQAAATPGDAIPSPPRMAPVSQRPPPDAAPTMSSAPLVPDAVVPPVAATDASTMSPKTWMVQASSFQDPVKAETLIQRLSAAGMSAHRLDAISDGASTWYRVMVGPVPNREEALKLLRRVDEVTGSRGQLITI
jgi:general secretion pathway protein D